MTQYTLVLLDTSGIQEYIFGSNQLAQNIGASELVDQVTGAWLLNSLTTLGFSNNMTWSSKDGVGYTSARVEDGKVDVEAIYAGGGNAVLIFAPSKDTKAFISHHSRYVLKNARGLQLQTIYKPFEWATKSIAGILNELRREIFARKMKRPASIPQPGLSVTAACVYTGLPASDRSIEDGFSHPISKEVADKLRAEPGGKERLHDILPQARSNGYGFVYDFDQFGEKGTSSYIAVVHTDGNGMGKRFTRLAEAHDSPEKNRDYVTTLRELSLSVRAQANKALGATVDFLIAGLKSRAINITIHEMSNIPLLPFRPIVFGGDDVTFVCDGRLGLQLAQVYLSAFSDGKLADGEPAHARAGIAVVKTHFPFSRAYNLAEDLALSAKEAIPSLKAENENSATVMDWHFSTTGVIRELKELRGKEYISKITKKSLLLRPIRIGTHPAVWRTWETFETSIKGFKQKEWSEKRNKMKDLQSALRGESEEVKVFLKNQRIKELPKIQAAPGLEETGWLNDTCGYFDALEALDFVEMKKEAA